MKLNISLFVRITLLVLLLTYLAPTKAALTDGLILHYDFETIAGQSVFDESHHSNSGTLFGSPTVTLGRNGNGVHFPTQTDYLSLPQGIVNSLTNFSVSTWVKMNALNGWSRIFDFGSGQSYNMFVTPMSGNSTLRFAIKNGVGEQLVDAPSALKTNEWVHVAVTYAWNNSTNQGVGKLYMNGVLAGTNQAFTINPSMLPLTTQNYIAKSQYPDPALNGTVDDFRIYNRALTDVEIMELNGFTTELMEAYNSIAIEGDLSKVQGNLVLGLLAGSTGIPVEWVSSAPDVIASNGTVNRPKLFDQNVTLTAKISILKDGETITMSKPFEVTVLASTVVHWESLILENNLWKYLPATSEPPSTWYQPSFVDAAWDIGKGGLGYADNDDSTIVTACNSLYLRLQVDVPNVSLIDRLVLDIDYDDAFVLYINGVECARSTNIVGAFPAYNKALTTDHEAKMFSGGLPERFHLKPSMLINGINTMAVHVLNQGLGSSDLSSRVFMHIRMRSEGIQYHATPSWFVEPTDPVSNDESNLPFVLIATNGLNIPQNKKIMVEMKVLNNPLGLNNINDTIYEYNGKVGIEIRGNTSAGFPKKSYTVETRLNDTTDINVSLLGLPRENDWVFHGPYPDKSLMRNVLAYHLGNLTGKWSPRTHYFELFLNGNYQGVYALVEKIKIDKNRMGLASLAPADTIGDELTGGYVVKIDRPEATDVDGKDYWISPYRAWTSLQQRVFFLFQDPDGEDLHPKQFNYIKQCITNFENAMYSDNYKDKETGYLPLVDFKSFVDYYIINELSRNLDGYRISTFMHKDKDSKGGKITMGPYWDYDICFGNANFFSAGLTEGWIIDGMGNADGYAMPFWWQKFRLDPYFNAYLKVYWNDWKEKYLNPSYLNTFIDSCATDLFDAQKRNFQTWDILTRYLWPNNAVPGSYAGELSYLKNWLSNRINWMDSQIQAITDVPDRLKQQTLTIDLVTYPNPFVEQVNFKFHLTAAGKVEIRIHDLMGRTVYRYEEYLNAGLHELPVAASDFVVSSPLYQYQVKVDGALRKTGKLIRKGN